MQAVFFDEEHARAAVLRLAKDGFDATCRRERFAGEDDDEDHPWSVTTDAPSDVLAHLVEEYDGWLEPDVSPRPTAPLELPDAPRRVKRNL